MAEKIRDYPKLASQILELVGGESNISQASRCATRLRLVLNETPAGAKAAVSNLPGVITVVESGGQFQVVIGTHVGEVLDALSAQANIDAGSGEAPKQSIMNRIIATMSAVFAPFVYLLAAAGLLQGVLIIVRAIWPAFTGTVEDQVFSFISWSPFAYLPILIAITASRHFKTNMFVAVWACAALVNPDWGALAGAIRGGEDLRLFGIALSDTVYTSTVLPPLFIVWLLSYLERYLNRYFKGAGQQIFVPLISVVIMVPLTLLAIGPLSAGMANGIAAGYNWAIDVVPILAGAIVGGFWQVAVIFGVHWGIQPVVLANFEQQGYDTFQAIQTAAVIAQVGAAFGVYFKTKNTQLKSVAAPAGVTGIFGITEPTIYGVTLRLKRPFILACAAGATGGVIIAMFGSVYYAYAGLPGMLTIFNSYSPDNPSSLIGMLIGCGVAFFGSMALVFFVGFKDPVEEDTDASSGVSEKTQEELDEMQAAAVAAYDLAAGSTASKSIISAPLAGRVVNLADVEDEVFASEAMGSGVAIRPSNDQVVAPFDGTVLMVMKTKHAIGLLSEDGLELLIHVGLDTVELDGEHFETLVEAKQKVKKGDALINFDRAAIETAGYSPVTVIIVTNSNRFSNVIPAPVVEVAAGDELLLALEMPKVAK